MLLFKLLATVISLGFGFSGGVFGPALFLGAVLGAALGNLFSLLAPDSLSILGIYAVAGMGAVISRVIGAPLATILIVFELTSNYALTTAVMLAVVMGRLVSRRSFPRSWFEFKLQQLFLFTNMENFLPIFVFLKGPQFSVVFEIFVLKGPQFLNIPFQ